MKEEEEGRKSEREREKRNSIIKHVNVVYAKEKTRDEKTQKKLILFTKRNKQFKIRKPFHSTHSRKKYIQVKSS